ncbi:uncharacterized protein LOC107842637 isoform X2 [Capsicum annuum]|uniref:uncharacterized protein LOC107842637 isoform X2 n=1 Tax=Capsicum annuum TaxID=4072 RepID=UPI001FB144AA|nr:uncharacterized protein LOC107842637 isoform X2 [Capsicum annuum]
MVEMAGNEEERLQIRPSPKARNCFNNYLKWKDKLRENCYKRVREDRSRLLWKLRCTNDQPHKDQESIRDANGQQQFFAWWKTHTRQFPKLSRVVRDVLASQASSVASKKTFSSGRFMIGDHRYSLAKDSLEITVLFRDWINAERRNFGLPKLPPQVEDEIDEIFEENNDDGMEAMEEQGKRLISENISAEEIAKLHLEYFGRYRYQ